jgi:hypothetical protein
VDRRSNNVCNTWLQAAVVLGFNVHVSTPPGYEVESGARGHLRRQPLRIVCRSVDACRGADLVTTDVWTSMGFEAEEDVRRRDFEHWQVDAEMMGVAKPDALFMHCLPAHRGEEVAAEVIDGRKRGVGRSGEPFARAEGIAGILVADESPDFHLWRIVRCSLRRRLFLLCSPRPRSSASAGELRPRRALARQAIHFVVSAGPGSSLDTLARAIGDKLRERLGQTVIVEKQAGGGGTVAVAEVARAAPDGYTMVLGFPGPLAFGPMIQKLPYDVARDLAPVIITSNQPSVLAVNAQLPVMSLQELVAYAKANPGKLNYASVGNGSSRIS